MEIENLVKLIETVSASELTGFKYEENGIKLHLTKKKEQVQIVAASDMNTGVNPAAVPETGGVERSSEPKESADLAEASGKIVESPLVGTFYAAPSEDAAPFVAAGDSVKKGQTLAIIEAMKLMNEIESEYDGVIEEILVENGQAVEYGQPLFRIR